MSLRVPMGTLSLYSGQAIWRFDDEAISPGWLGDCFGAKAPLAMTKKVQLQLLYEKL
jgi:hypothetical protein